MTERSVAARAAAALREAKRAFAANDYPLALARISQAVALNHLTLEVVELFDVLLGAADPDAAAALLGDLLDDAWGDWPPDFHASLAARRFDALRALPATGAEELAEAALETLEAAAAGDMRAWRPVADPDRRAALLSAVAAPSGALLALEQLAYAPVAAGLRAHAVALAESFGHAHLGEPDLARAAERVLFRLGAPASAHRVESGRKATRPRPDSRPAEPAPLDLAGRLLVIAGGHDRLRAAVRDELRGAGLRGLREVPPTWEGQLGASLRGLVQGADLMLLVVRQLDHSTGDAVVAAAAAEAVPVVRVPSASVAGIRSAAVDALAGKTRP